jgi:hypothetical protein
MFRRIFLALPLVGLTLAGVAFAQADVTMILRSGERIKGSLSDHGGVGFTMRVNGQERVIPQDQVAIVDFGGTEMTDADWAKVSAGTHVVYLKNGMTFSGEFYDISGKAPLSIVIKTQSGEQRTFSSTETARIVLARPASAVATSGTAAAAPGAGGGIVVPATEAWVSAGIRVRRGEWVTFNTTGEVRLTTDAADVAGAAGSNANRTAANAPLPGTPIGTLIGRVGNSRPFVIGNQTRVQMPAGGVLFLGINDDHLADNAGELRVQVQGGGR